MKTKKFQLFYLAIVTGMFLFLGGCDDNDIDENDHSSNNQTNGKTTALFNPNISYGEMTDQDGNVYKTVNIGTQTWMAENLRTTKYNDGTAIPNVKNGKKWSDLTTGAYCNHDNTTDTEKIATYGRLYNWYTVKTGKLAPKGWHVPTDQEWRTLANYLTQDNSDGGETGDWDYPDAGGKLKETGTLHWDTPNEGATNESGFTALPGDRAVHSPGFSEDFWLPTGIDGFWWTSTEGHGGAYSYYLAFHGQFLRPYINTKDYGYSVRCVKD